MTGTGGAPAVRRLERSDITVVDKKTLHKAVSGTILGTIMEWYDVGVFGYLITTMGPVFLPDSDPTLQALFLLGTFAVTFIVRPAGGVFYGWLGDRIGRQKVLAATLMLIALSTTGIGLLPGHAQIGAWAAVLLVLLKLLQGFSAGGEFAGAATFVSEYAPDRRRGFYTGFMTLSSYLGFALGAGVVAALHLLLGAEAMQEYGWRIPFLVAAPLGIIAFWFRYRIEETPTFKAVLDAQAGMSEEQKKLRRPRGMVRAHAWLIIASIGVVAGENVVAYALTSYMPTYLTLSLGFDEIQGALLTLPVLVVTALLCPVTGFLSDRFGRKRVLWAASISTVLLGLPAFLLLGTGSIGGALAGIAMLAVPAILYAGGISAAVPAQFPTAMRYLGMGLAYNIGVAAFGGTSPFIMESLVTATGSAISPAWYLIAIGLIATVSIAFLRETAGRPLPGAGPSVSTEAEADAVLAAQDSDAVIRESREALFAQADRVHGPA